MKKHYLISIQILSIFILASCASAPPQKTPNIYAEVPLTSTFYLESFDLKLSQRYTFPKYINEEQLEEVVRDSFILGLRKADINLVDNKNADIHLSVFVDYLRQFHGDGTPWPMETVRTPKIRYDFVAKKGSAVIFSFQSGNLVSSGNFNDPPETSIERDIMKDYDYANSVGIEIASQVTHNVEGATTDRTYNIQNFINRVIAYEKAFAPTKKQEFTQYIPHSEIEPYLEVLKNGEYEDRIDTYKKIRTGWYNNPKLFNYLEQKVNALYLSQKESSIKEAREAMNALASSGMLKYKDLFKKIQSAKGVHEDVSDEVEDSLDILKKRANLAPAIHDMSGHPDNLPWRVKQLANLVTNANIRIADYAVRDIYRNFRKNPYLLQTMTEMLEDEAFLDSYQAHMRSDLHAWAIRIIGVAGDPAYLPLLQRLAKNAVNEKVREYAEEYYEELQEIIEEE